MEERPSKGTVTSLYASFKANTWLGLNRAEQKPAVRRAQQSKQETTNAKKIDNNLLLVNIDNCLQSKL